MSICQTNNAMICLMRSLIIQNHMYNDGFLCVPPSLKLSAARVWKIDDISE